MDNKLIKTLTDLGLTDNEADVYFASLSLGSTTILKIARTAKIKRTTVYSVVESLKQKGLMNIELKGFKQLFVAENPEKLESILENRKTLLQKALPEFSSLYNLKGGESFIKYYEGLEAIKTVYEGLIKDVRHGDSYSIISETENWYNLDPKFFENFLQRRAKLDINVRLLTQESKIAGKLKQFEKNYNEKVKFLPKNTKLSTNMVVTPQKVVIQQTTQPIMAIVIENRSVIKMHQEFFEIMWRSIK
jgi:sugar-specific transcriptional regulator TrmB